MAAVENIFLSRMPWEIYGRKINEACFAAAHPGAPTEIFNIMTREVSKIPRKLHHSLADRAGRIGHLTVTLLPHKRAGVTALCYLILFVPLKHPDKPANDPLVHQVMDRLRDDYLLIDTLEINEWILTVAEGRELGHYELKPRFPFVKPQQQYL
ncbi:MAG: hypothetical protein H0Z39_09835 [Peptococcaceae bacterium]|nr:hypothetical protein [Peptococcaceae bacterium]